MVVVVGSTVLVVDVNLRNNYNWLWLLKLNNNWVMFLLSLFNLCWGLCLNSCLELVIGFRKVLIRLLDLLFFG
jgi:hypothetical protein